MSSLVTNLIDWVKNMKTSMRLVIGVWLLFAVGSLERAQVFIHTLYPNVVESWVYAVSLEMLIVAGYACLSTASRDIYRKMLWRKAWHPTIIGLVAGVGLFAAGAYAQCYMAYLAAAEVVKDGSFTGVGMMVQIGNVCLLIIFFAFDISDFMEQERDKWMQAENLRRQLELECQAAKAREDATKQANLSWCPHCEQWRSRKNFGRHLAACAKLKAAQ